MCSWQVPAAAVGAAAGAGQALSSPLGSLPVSQRSAHAGPCSAHGGAAPGAHLTARGWRTQTPASSQAGGSQGECRSKGKLHGAVSCGSPGRPLQETRRGSAAPGSSLMEQWQVKLKSPVSVVQYL